MAIDQAKLVNLRSRLVRLEASAESGADAETHYFDLLRELLEHDGYVVTAMRAHPARGIDLTATRSDRGTSTSLGVEVKHYQRNRPIPPDVLDNAIANATKERLDRLLLVANRPYSPALQQLAAHTAPIAIGLLDFAQLRAWLDRIGQTLSDATRTFIDLSREYLVRAARLIASKPDVLNEIEWRKS